MSKPVLGRTLGVLMNRGAVAVDASAPAPGAGVGTLLRGTGAHRDEGHNESSALPESRADAGLPLWCYFVADLLLVVVGALIVGRTHEGLHGSEIFCCVVVVTLGGCIGARPFLRETRRVPTAGAKAMPEVPKWRSSYRPG